MSLKELAFTFRHPGIVLSYLRMKERIAKLTGTTVEEVNRYSDEPSLATIGRKVVENFQGYGPLVLGSGKKPRKGVAYYLVCRVTKPAIVVETGVQSGISSAFILQALKDNGKGYLYSIDWPDNQLLQIIPSQARRGMESGWVVPRELAENWKLITGKSKEKLLPLLRHLTAVDIFIHDSEHSFENMYEEYETAWRFLASNGILLSDDIHLNQAFRRFTSKLEMRPTKIIHSIGAVRKPRTTVFDTH
jgi:hypothetical protein